MVQPVIKWPLRNMES